jgi:hypothetical protein
MNHDETNRRKTGFLGCKCFDCIFKSKNVIDVTKSASFSNSASKLDAISDEKKLISEDKKLINKEKIEAQKKKYSHHISIAKNFLSPPNSILENSIDSHNNLIIKRQRSKSEIGD